jgi:hypothetical protein
MWEAMVGTALKQAFIGTVLSGVLAGLMGCTSMMPQLEPRPLVAKPQPTVSSPKVVRQKKVAVKKVVKPVGVAQTAEEAPEKPPVIPALGGGGGGTGGSSGGSAGGNSGW